MTTRLVGSLTICSALIFLAGCDNPSIDTALPVSPVVKLAPAEGKANGEAIAVSIAGPRGLRGLQATVVYSGLEVVSVDAGPDAERIDRLFFAPLADAKGRLLVGLTDTRQVRLPARGTLMLLSIQRAGRASLSLQEMVAVQDDGTASSLADATLELK